MREIKFRGKAKNSDWKYGCLELDQVTNRYSILMGYEDLGYEVEEDSIGQYTGLKDKNGVEIYEGDIVNIEYRETTIERAVIEYKGTSFYGATNADDWELDMYYSIEVIGNIYDNPELIEKEGK